MRNVIVPLLVALIVACLALPFAATLADAAPVGVSRGASKPVGKTGRLAALAPGGSLDVTHDIITVRSDGAATISLRYLNAGSRLVHRRTVSVPANRSEPVIDENGVVLSATVPAALGNAIDAFQAQVASMVTTAAGNGKLDL